MTGLARPTSANTSATRVTVVGECMVELTHHSDRTLALDFAGDTFNTAVYVARGTLARDVCIDYVTAVGDDWYSDELVSAIETEGIGTELIERIPDHSPGLYLVRTDDQGERTFTYHRSESAARHLFDDGWPERINRAIGASDLIYLSAITLQILSASARERLWSTLSTARARGAKIAFDSNFRRRGWPTVGDARAAIERTVELTDLYLPTLADEQVVFGDRDGLACAQRIAGLGLPECVIKDGERGCLVLAAGDVVSVPARHDVPVVDTTAAGDSFNAGYIAARLRGEARPRAAESAHLLAAQVVGGSGAILPAGIVPRREQAKVPSDAV